MKSTGYVAAVCHSGTSFLEVETTEQVCRLTSKMYGVLRIRDGRPTWIRGTGPTSCSSISPAIRLEPGRAPLSWPLYGTTVWRAFCRTRAKTQPGHIPFRTHIVSLPPKDTACRLFIMPRSSLPQTVNGKRFGGNSPRPVGADQSKPIPPERKGRRERALLARAAPAFVPSCACVQGVCSQAEKHPAAGATPTSDSPAPALSPSLPRASPDPLPGLTGAYPALLWRESGVIVSQRLPRVYGVLAGGGARSSLRRRWSYLCFSTSSRRGGGITRHRFVYPVIPLALYLF